MESDWAGFRPPYGLGAEYVVELAADQEHDGAREWLRTRPAPEIEALLDAKDRAERDATLAEVASWKEGDEAKAAPVLARLRDEDPDLFDEVCGLVRLNLGWDEAKVELHAEGMGRRTGRRVARPPG